MNKVKNLNIRLYDKDTGEYIYNKKYIKPLSILNITNDKKKIIKENIEMNLKIMP